MANTREQCIYFRDHWNKASDEKILPRDLKGKIISLLRLLESWGPHCHCVHPKPKVSVFNLNTQDKEQRVLLDGQTEPWETDMYRLAG